MLHSDRVIQKLPAPVAQVVEDPLWDWEIVGSIPSSAIPKALKMVPVATLLGAQHYKASTGFSSPNIYCKTNIPSLTNKSKKKNNLITIIVCIHRRTIWKIGRHDKYVILLKYRKCYYYYYRTNNVALGASMCTNLKMSLQS